MLCLCVLLLIIFVRYSVSSAELIYLYKSDWEKSAKDAQYRNANA